MTLSSTKFRGSGHQPKPQVRIPYGSIVDREINYDILFLQDYKSTFTANMPPRIGPWTDSPQVMDYVVNGLAIAYPASRFGLAHFSDYPTSPYGDPDEDFVYKEIIPLTSATEIYPLEWNTYAYTNAQHEGLGSVNGGDTYNCALDATVEAAQSTTIGWSPSAFSKRIFVFTDQFPHDSSNETGVPHTNLTAASAIWNTQSVFPTFVVINDTYYNNFQRYNINGFYGSSYLFSKSSIYGTTPDYYFNPIKISEFFIRLLWNGF